MHQPLPSEIDAIIFDFGGVLFDIDYPAPARAFKSLGVQNFEGLYSKANQNDLFDRLEVGTISNADFLEELRQLTGGTLTTAQVLWAWNTILTGIPVGRVEALHSLQGRFRCFLLSNTNAIHVEAFEPMVDDAVGLAHFKSAFEKTHYSNEIGMRKPHPETYLEICKWHSLTPSRTLFIDDSPQHVEGALQAGLHAYHLVVEKEDVRDVIARL